MQDFFFKSQLPTISLTWKSLITFYEIFWFFSFGRQSAPAGGAGTGGGGAGSGGAMFEEEEDDLYSWSVGKNKVLSSAILALVGLCSMCCMERFYLNLRLNIYVVGRV